MIDVLLVALGIVALVMCAAVIVALALLLAMLDDNDHDLTGTV